VFSAPALALIVALEIFAPRDGGLLSETDMLATFIAGVVGTGIIVFAFVIYAVREVTRAGGVRGV
jgi:adenylate cyclase